MESDEDFWVILATKENTETVNKKTIYELWPQKFTILQFTARPVLVTDPKIAVLVFKISYSLCFVSRNRTKSNTHFLEFKKKKIIVLEEPWRCTTVQVCLQTRSHVTPNTDAACRYRGRNRAVNHWGVYNFREKNPGGCNWPLQSTAPCGCGLTLCRGHGTDCPEQGHRYSRDWPKQSTYSLWIQMFKTSHKLLSL